MLTPVRTSTTTSYYVPSRAPALRSSSHSWSSGMTRDLTRNPDTRADTASAANSRRTKRRVLVVDDENDLVDLISYNLSRGGFEVLTAYDWNEDLGMAQSVVPDLDV